MSDGYSIVDGKKVSGRRISFDGENLSVNSASPVDELGNGISAEEMNSIGDNMVEMMSKMSDAGDTVDAFVSENTPTEDLGNGDNIFVDDITAGHCFETPYGKIYVKSTEPVDVTLLERTKSLVKKNAIPFGVGLAVGLIGCGLYGLLKGKED